MIAFVFLLLFAVPHCFADQAAAKALASSCGQTTCTSYQVDLHAEHLELMDRDESGKLFGSFDALMRWGAPQGKTLRFAANAGIFDKRFSTLGLLIKGGQKITNVNTADGAGNFFLKPNGIFYLSDNRAYVVETSQYPGSDRVTLATQSGPLLLLGGVVNAKFVKDSANKVIRSGVGVNAEHQPVFVISDGPISFYDFSLFFKDALGCKDALYLDGVISQMYVAELGRTQKGGKFAAMFAIFEKENSSQLDETAASGTLH